ncbi:MAG: hypothetical protein V1842_04265, partial [Candidatus Omnitrophota bacterium]
EGGIAEYEEDEQGVTSEFESEYGQLTLTALNRNDNDVEKTVSVSMGTALEDGETWYVNSAKYQSNDLDFYKGDFLATIGKILYSDRYSGLRAIPFVGYGFRYFKFERSNFNILNLITLREVVTEEYYLHHFDCGLKLENDLNDRLQIQGMGGIGYVFYNQADNSSLGKVDGSGGYIIDAGLGLRYLMSDSWKLILAGFMERQYLNGGKKGNVIWPDNDLNIYGANIGMQYLF